jgi:hypothetical protein
MEQKTQEITNIGAQKWSEKPTKTEVRNVVAHTITRTPPYMLPEFPLNIKKINLGDGVQLPLLVDENNICKITNDKEVIDIIVTYCKTKCYEFSKIRDVGPKEAEEILHYAMSYQPTFAMPKSFRWAGETYPAFNELPWSFNSEKTSYQMPTWQELLNRMTNSEAFCTWVGSLFFDDSDLQQYVWLYGEGRNGKGSFCRFLKKVFGNSYSAEIAPMKGSIGRFWLGDLIDKRIVAFPECKSSYFVLSQEFMQMTGGDELPCELKFKGRFSSAFNAKYLFCSNIEPKVLGEPAHQRRIIYCVLGNSTDQFAKHEYEQRLWNEGGDFIMYCINKYQTLCPNGEEIPVDDNVVAELVEENEAKFRVFFNDWFQVRNGTYIGSKELTEYCNRNDILKDMKNRRIDMKDFRGWLTRNGFPERNSSIDGVSKFRHRLNFETKAMSFTS